MALSKSLLFLHSPDSVVLSSSPLTWSTNASSPRTLAFSFMQRRRRPIDLRLSAMASLSVAGDQAAVRPGEDLPEDYGMHFPAGDAGKRRRAGVLLHPSSLQGPYGIGDFGDEAIRFLDWLHSTGCSVWQVLVETGPTWPGLEFAGELFGLGLGIHRKYASCLPEVLPLVPPGRKANEDGSPYAGQDANCGNTLLISLEELVKDGLLMKNELPEHMDMEQVQFAAVSEIKDPLIAKAAERLISSQGELKQQFDSFCRDTEISGWLDDAATFAAIDRLVDTFTWNEWPESLKNLHLSALVEIYRSQKQFIDIFTAQQFLFQRQWQKIRMHAKRLGIKIMGDMPIYVGYHSADVWANKKSFLLDRNGFPVLVSGVPPDAFSETGQLWDSPLYDWRAMKDNGFAWWIKRIQRAVDLYDEFRIDHFRGFAGFWAVPSDAKIATFGRWKAGPGKAFFDTIFKAVGRIEIIAEDLGVITEDVVQLRKGIGAPGMVVLQFAFGSGPDNPHLPHNHEPDQVVYTGTHDNDTALGWWENIQEEERSNVEKYLWMASEANISWAMIHSAISSVARTAIIPMQDILGLGSDARMNTPATQFGNWRWRIPSSVSFDRLEPEAQKLRGLLFTYNRL